MVFDQERLMNAVSPLHLSEAQKSAPYIPHISQKERTCEIQSGGTYGQSHHFQPPPDELDHHALLQRSGAAAEHRAAVLRQLQELLLQPSLEDDVQRPSINHQPKLGAGGLRD